MQLKASEMGVELDGGAAGAVADRLKQLESEGYHFETADASLELLMREATGWQQDYFRLEGYRVTTYHRNATRGGVPIEEDDDSMVDTEASIKVWVGDERRVAIGEGNGPVNALDHALRTALNGRYPELERIHLTDYKVRVLDSAAATGAVVRVLIDSTDGDRTWTTIGVDANVIEASWQALVDSIVYGLLHCA
jgi:2-isopropylmalate synthase